MKQPHRTNRPHLRLILPFTALLALPPPALLFAQTAADTEESVALPTVVVTGEKVATDSSFGTRINTALIETPQAISVVTRAEMDARGVQRLTDAVGYTAGVRPESGGIDSRTEFLTIRGYSVSGSGNSYIYLDGLRGLTGGGWTYSSFDTFGLERVEILKGPSAVLYGQVSPGGIVNAVSKRPDAAQPDSVGVQYGSFNTVQGTFDVGGGNQDGSLQFRLLGLGRDGESEIDYTDLRRTFVAPSLTWNISERTSLTFLVQHQKDEGGSTFQFLPRTGTLVSGTGGFRFDQSDFIGESDWNNYERTQYALGYQFEHAFNDTFTFRNNLRYLAAETDYKAVVATGTDANAATGVLARRIMWGYGESANLTVDSHLQSKLSTGAVDHTLLTGVDFYRSDWDNTRWLRATDSINIYNIVNNGVNQAHLAAMLAGNPQVRQDVTESQLGLYAQEQAVWGRLHGTVGVRFDSYELDSTNLLTNTKSEVSPDSTTWRAGLLYHFDSGLAPYASYTTSFDAGPYTTTNPATGRAFEDPTTSDQWEVGLKYQPKTFKALFTASIFELTETDRLSYYKDIATNLVYANQSGEARTRGLELEARVELLKGFDVIAGYAYLDTEITESSVVNNLETQGNHLPGVPNHTASLWLAHTFSDSAFAGLTLGSGVRYAGETYDNVNNVTEIPDYTLFDASIGYDFGKRFASLRGLSARLSATNLADKRYVASANVAPGGTGAAVAYYGSGRNVSLSLRYAW